MATPEVNRVYSTDKKLWVGMKVEDAYKDKETLDIFLFADKNNNKQIDDWEMDRYNSPILVENKETKEGRFVGVYRGKMRSGVVSGDIIKDNEREYYSGLKLEQVEEKDAIQRFQELDIAPKDKVLSKNEIEIAMLEKEHSDLLKELDEEKQAIRDDHVRKLMLSDFLGDIVGGGVLGVGMMTGLLFEPPVAAIAGIVAGTGVLAAGITHLATKKKDDAKIQEIEQKIAEENTRYEQKRQELLAQAD